MKFENIQDKIDFLKKCAKLYENTGNSPITNDEFDKLYNEAKEEDSDNDFFKEVGSKPNFGERVTHKRVMGSLNKCADASEFSEWLDKNYGSDKERFLEKTEGFLLQPKLDGVAISLLYTFGQLHLAATRGNGTYGVDITKIVREIKDIPNEIAFKISPIEVRGEIYKDQIDFYENWAGEYANPRNFTAGTLNLKNLRKVRKRNLSFMAYDVLGQPFATEMLKLNFLQQIPIKNITNETSIAQGTFKNIKEKVNKYANKTTKSRDELSHPVDGIVIKLNNTILAESMGKVGKKPKAHVARKLPVEQKWTTLKDVEFKTTRTGKISVVGILEPINLAQTEVSRVTLYNIDFIKKQDLAIGKQVLIQKSGDIIPRLMRAKGNGKSIELPSVCPTCGFYLNYDKNNKFLVCNNEYCSAQAVGRLEYFFKKLMIKGFGVSTLTKLVEEFDANSPYFIYNTFKERREDIRDLLGEKNRDNLESALENKRKVTLSEFLSAYNIGGVSSIMDDLLNGLEIKEFSDLLTVTSKDIQKVKGFGETKANKFISDFNAFEQDMMHMIKENFITIDSPKKTFDTKLSFCFTGKLERPRKELEKMVKDRGGKVKKSVTLDLDYLVHDGKIKSSKYRKARKNEIKIIDYNGFLAIIEE